MTKPVTLSQRYFVAAAHVSALRHELVLLAKQHPLMEKDLTASVQNKCREIHHRLEEIEAFCKEVSELLSPSP